MSQRGFYVSNIQFLRFCFFRLFILWLFFISDNSHNTHPVFNPHFFEYIIDMSFNRTLRNKQGLCDFRIAASLVNQFNKLFFPVRQIILLFDFLESVLKAKLRSLVAIAEICRNKGASVDKIYHNNIYDKPEYDSQIQRFSDEPAVSPVYGSLAPEV